MENGKQTRASQIPNSFRHPESRLSKSGRPLCHRCFGCTGTNHQQNHHPQQWQPKQLAKRKALAIFYKALYGTARNCTTFTSGTSAQSNVSILQFLVPNTAKKRIEPKTNAHCTPAVKRMQQTHPAVLVFKGTRFHDRAHQHFYKTAAYGVKHHCNENPRKGTGIISGRIASITSPTAETCLGGHHADPIPDFVRKPWLPPRSISNCVR